MALLVVALVLTACASSPPPVVGQVPVPAPAPQIEPDPTQLRIGVDDLGIGFNPHRTADLTPTSRTTAGLVLPSAFRIGPDGQPQLDTTVVTSVKVTDNAPWTVSYEIAPAATWSDNAPIAAEDFVYLWEQMRSQPGVVGASGYRAISEVRSRAGGKAVDVVFDRPYPAWRTLFDDLLPAHLLKDAPGAWGGALTDSIPVSGGPYVVRIVDRIRGEVTLARNDRYWGTPAVSDEVVLQAADHAALIDRVRTGDVQATQFRADGDDVAALARGGAGTTVRSVPEPQMVQLALRSDAGPLADVRVRRAVAASLDRNALVAAGADGGPSAGLRADAFAIAPSEDEYRPTLPADAPAARPDPIDAARDLAAAGYARDAEGRWSRDGAPLVLRLAAPPQASPYGRLITTLAAQLDAAGFDTAVVADAGANPFPPGRGPAPTTTAAAATPTPSTPAPSASPPSTPGATAPGGAAPGVTAASTPAVPGGGSAAGSSTTRTTPGSSTPATSTTSVPPIPDSPSDMVVADLTVLALPIGGDPVADLDSIVGCPGQRAPRTSGTPSPVAPTTTATTTPAPTSSAVPPSAAPGPASPSTSAAPTSTTTAGSAVDDDGRPRASEALSPTGWCDPATQALLDAAASGAVTRETALALVEPTLWSAVPAIPLFQAASVLVAPSDRTDVVVGPLGTSPFSTADRWTPPPRLARANGDSN